MTDKPDNVKEFTRAKRETPDELTYMMRHWCMDDHSCLKYLIQMRGSTLCFVCSDCADVLTMEEVVKAMSED